MVCSGGWAMNAKRIIVGIIILIVFLGGGIFIYSKNNQNKPVVLNELVTNTSGYFVRGDFLGEEVISTEEAQSKLPFKFALPEILGNPDKILIQEGHMAEVVYGYKGNDIFKENSRVVQENGAILIYEYKPGLTKEEAESLIDDIIKQMDLYDDTRDTQQRVYINGFPGVMGGNVDHCVTWYTPQATYTVGGSIKIPLEELVKIAEGMDEGN
jgi:hypothetical protein